MQFCRKESKKSKEGIADVTLQGKGAFREIPQIPAQLLCRRSKQPIVAEQLAKQVPPRVAKRKSEELAASFLALR